MKRKIHYFYCRACLQIRCSKIEDSWRSIECFKISKMANLLLAWNTRILLLSTIAVLSCPSVRPHSSNVTYGELEKLNARCDGLDTCRAYRGTNNLLFVNCHCDAACATLDTCCLDSEYRTHGREQEIGPLQCQQPYGVTSDSVFLVVGCKPGWSGDDSVRDLCTGHPGDLKDPFLMVPVTDLKTGISYKNYFCFVCNGADRRSDPPVFWEIKLFSDPDMNNHAGKALFRDMEAGTKAVADYIFNDFYFYRSVEIAEELRSRVKWCRGYIVSTCDENWTDVPTKEKCESYTAVVWTKKDYIKRYRNPHCAICNYVDVSDLKCSEPEGAASNARGPPYGYLFVGLLSLEDKVKRCPRNHVFDKFSKKCRAVRCGIRKKMVDGECVA